MVTDGHGWDSASAGEFTAKEHRERKERLVVCCSSSAGELTTDDTDGAGWGLGFCGGTFTAKEHREHKEGLGFRRGMAKSF